ncbi:hypothetical protein ACFX19_003233 [Malus domestica]
MLELQDALKINNSLKKEVDELQRIRAGLLKENEQLKGEKVGLEALLTQSQADFYTLGYVNYFFGRPSDFEFFGKDFETFSISMEDLLAFTFEVSIGEVVGEADAQAGVVGDEALNGATAEGAVAAEGVATE